MSSLNELQVDTLAHFLFRSVLGLGAEASWLVSRRVDLFRIL